MCEPGNLPPLFTEEASRAAWEGGRREALLCLLRDQVYGAAPTEGWSTSCMLERTVHGAMGLQAECRVYTVQVRAPLGEYRFPFYLYLPAQQAGPLPVLLFIHNREKELILPERARPDGFFPVDALLARGFAAAAFWTEDVDTDTDDGFVNGVFSAFEQDPSVRAPDAWCTIAAWAFGARRVLDCLADIPGLRGDRVSLVGHSRGGKAALWSAACDERFYSVYGSCSGCTGAALARGKRGETVAAINERFPYWFCGNYKNWSGRETEMPFDQHMLLALIAPRPLYAGSASEDDWADPQAEFRALKRAGAAFEAYGRKGVEGEFPAAGTPLHGGRIGYHLRAGGHDLTAWDWARYLDFLQVQGAE